MSLIEIERDEYQSLRDAADERDSLRAEVARLREALAPFAKWARIEAYLLRRYNDDYVWKDAEDLDPNAVDDEEMTITLGDLRRAAAALAGDADGG